MIDLDAAIADPALIDDFARAMRRAARQMGPICLRNADGRFAVAHRPGDDRGPIALHARAHLFDPADSVQCGAILWETGRWSDLAAAGWRLD